MIRRQLPAYSPLSARLLFAAALRAPFSAAERPVFEEYLCERFGADRAVLTGSGTHALQLALTWAGAGETTATTAMPAYSCFDLVTAAAGAEAGVLFYDVDPVSMSPERASVREALGAGAGSLVAASAYGFPLDWDWLRQESRSHGVLLIEDAAQGLGSKWSGRPGGSFGDLTVLSFGRGKGWTGGAGGALLVRATASEWVPDLEARVAAARSMPVRSGSLAPFVKSVAQWAFGRPALYRLPTSVPGLGLGETTYHDPTPVSAMPAFAVCAARRHADLAAGAVEERVLLAQILDEAQRDAKRPAFEVCRPLTGGTSAYLRYPFLVSDESERSRLLELGGDLGVSPGYPIALPGLREAEPLLAGPVRPMPGAKRLAGSLVTLPTHQLLAPPDVRAIRDLLRS